MTCDQNSLSEKQKLAFAEMNQREQNAVMAGQPILVAKPTEPRDEVSFNMENVEISEFNLQRLAKSLLPSVRKFYEDENNVRAYEEWLKTQEETQPKKRRKNKS